ncbi:MAG: FAD-binding protein [Anaerolineae bacterium]|nr:FAD-binding protein [Anaerolineae bacterium]MBL8106870.1 FAD-binding protein [Anaerolineales bacterium]MCC7187391.1 FAD-binding protein [Anaerolineales bacterium]
MPLPREFLYELHKHFTGDIRTDSASRILYSTDASIYQIEPLGVVIPRNQEELHAAVELAAKYKIPILPRGAGTSLAGQAVGEALILDCSRWLDKIVEINPEEKFAIVEPGVVLSDLNKAASKHGLMFGPDPASAERATMGGVIANNATGAHSIVYGMSADHILEAEVILGDGSLATWGEVNEKLSVKSDKLSVNSEQSRVVGAVFKILEKYADAIKRSYPKTWRNAMGYRLNYLLPWSPSAPPQWDSADYGLSSTVYRPSSDINLARLLAGSEGTLAVIRKMKVNLVSKPKHTILAVLTYASAAEACDDVPRLLSHNPSAIELIPDTIIRAARSSAGYASEASWIQGDPSSSLRTPAAVLVVEFSGGEPKELLMRARGLVTPQSASTAVFVSAPLRSDLRSARNGENIFIAESKEDQARIWNVRKMGLGLLDSQPRSARPIAFIEDCAIPVERLGEFVREVEKILSAHDVVGNIYAHASAGCLHIRPVLDLKTTRGVESLRLISEAVLALTLSLGGAMSSEHGDGLARSEHLARAYGAEVMDAMRLLKNAADPNHIMNPGKIIDAPKMDANLRYGVDYQTKSWKPNLSFARQGGFELAVEQCNGQGVCRKSTGVMCPSFQATRDEMHSTRGRANLLRALIARPQTLDDGRFMVNGLSSDVFEALDLCLACKGCKAECPSGVDMAKLKYEFENEYYKTHPRPLRDYVFGYFHVAAKMMSYVAPLANGLMEFASTKKLIAKVLGLAEERPLPQISSRRAKLRTTETLSHGEKIIFLPDVFSRYIEPQVEEAALEVLTMCGYDVRVLPIVGAGASLLSKGFVDAARRHAREMLRWLNQIDPSREAFIVGVEPPEIYLLKNDYADLLPESKEEIRARESKVWLLDEFLLRSSEFGALRVGRLGDQLGGEGNRNRKIKFHPHCHQRAEGLSADGIASGANASVELLRACGFDVELSDAGCCGMAGTFGFETEHYEVSMKVFEMAVNRGIVSRGVESSEWKVYTEPSRSVEIASTGAACRMQFQHGANVDARHPIEWVRDALV